MPADSSTSARTLRLLWPQWQGAGADLVARRVPEIDEPDARRGYAVGTTVLEAVLPPHDGPTAVVPVGDADDPVVTDGIESRPAVLEQLRAAVQVIAEHDPERIVTLGGECSVSVAPFAAMAQRYGDDLAVIWIDAHPDVGVPGGPYAGYHAMAVSHLVGHGDPEVVAALPATIAPERLALVGLHSWREEDYAHVAEWGVTEVGPADLRDSSDALLGWLRGTGCSKVAIHLDVDVVDGDEVVLGLVPVPGGLTSAQTARIVADLGAVAEVVAFTVAEYLPRQVIRLQRLLRGMPLL